MKLVSPPNAEYQPRDINRLPSDPIAAAERALASLNQAQELTELLLCETDYSIPPLDFTLPANFKLSIVVPVFNEEATILQVLARLQCLPLPTEIIVVDDCSTDNTRQLLADVEASADIQVIHKPCNEGKGAALRTGFRHASGNVVVVQDADLEYDPRDIPALLKPLVEDQADVVYGSRFLHEKPADPSLLHRLGNGLLTWSSNMLTGLRITDMETCYKAFRRDVLGSFEIQQNRLGFEPEVTAKLARRRYRLREVPIGYNARSYAEGKKIGIRDLFNAVYCIVRYGLLD
jgi:glycosyltransferase involved in cell wall biosynthesis